MNLTEEQKQAVAKWAADGAGLSEIQSRLADEFGARLSYMETRLLVLDIGAQIKDREPEAAPEPKRASAPAAEDEESDIADDAAASPLPGGVSVEISPITRPGFALAGTVVFSDGVTAEWGFMSDGRFALAAADPKYKPTAEDLREFQTQLRNQMTRRGY